jgi:3-phosphoshikimate 1-carboxyvinyltransferase
MKKIIYPFSYQGSITAPPSKSFMQRAIAIALLAKGKTTLTNTLLNNDTKSALNMAEGLGATINVFKNEITILGSKGIKHHSLSAGESGLGIRCFVPIASLFNEKVTFNGTGSLKNRPLGMLEEPLKDLGAKVNTSNGFLPVNVQGPIKGGDIIVDGCISSQVLTGMLIALPKVKNNSVIGVIDLKSKPYVDMTLQIIEDFGGEITNQNYETFHVEGNQTYLGRNYEIEGDWSGIAFHLVGAAISGSVEVTGINIHSTQADRQITHALKQAGAFVSYESGKITVSKNELNAFEFDATHCPDLFPPLSNLAAACKGTSVIKGVSRLTHKESNRALTIQKEWAKLGIEIELTNDEMHIKGGVIKGGEINSHNDHRIAMMGAIATVSSDMPVIIHESEAINKSYPSFFVDLEKVNTRKI